MTTISAAIAFVLLVLRSTPGLPEAPRPQESTPDTAVKVQMVDHAGTPVSGVAIRLLDTNSAFIDGLTDDQGFVTLPLGTRRIDNGVFVSFGVAPAPLTRLGRASEVREAIRKSGEATRRSAFHALYRVRSSEPLIIRGRNAVSMSVEEVTTAKGVPVEVAYSGGRTGLVSLGIWKPGTTPLTIAGIERGSRGDVYLAASCTVRPVDFDEATSTDDVKLKSVALPPLGSTGSLTISFDGDGPLEDVGLRPYLGGASLLSSDGTAIYTYLLRPSDGSARRISVAASNDARSEGIPPPGRYFLCAGFFSSGRHDAADVREVMRRGGKLEELGIPFVDIVDGADTKVNFDPAKARAAARKAARTLPDDPAN